MKIPAHQAKQAKQAAERLDVLEVKLTDMAETLMTWMDDNFAYSALQVYFLCGVLKAMIEGTWPDDPPQAYTDLLAAIEEVGATIGPAIVIVEIKDPPEGRDQVSCERQRKTRKKDIH